jgi:hypothetical protein
MYQNAVKYRNWQYYIPNGHKMYQPFPIQGPPKFAQIGILGLKIYNLATLIRTLEIRATRLANFPS